MKQITIRDIASHAGVSVATVSRVINNVKVRSKNEQAVREIIDKMNFHPNSIAQSLKNDSTRTIGFLVSDISNDYLIGIGKAIEDIVSTKGYNIIVCSTDSYAQREITYLRMLMGKKVDAIVLNSTGSNDEYVSQISHHIPIVLLHRKILSPGFMGDFVDCDNRSGSYLITRHFIDLGHRKIGCLSGPKVLSTATERLHGFFDALELPIDDRENYPFLSETDFTYAGGYSGTKMLMEKEEKPTAIIAMNNALALGALHYLKKNNIHVPNDCSLANFGTIPNVNLLYAQPSYVTLDASLIGKMTAEAVLDRIKNPKKQNNAYIFTSQLVIGTAEQFQ